LKRLIPTYNKVSSVNTPKLGLLSSSGKVNLDSPIYGQFKYFSELDIGLITSITDSINFYTPTQYSDIFLEHAGLFFKTGTYNLEYTSYFRYLKVTDEWFYYPNTPDMGLFYNLFYSKLIASFNIVVSDIKKEVLKFNKIVYNKPKKTLQEIDKESNKLTNGVNIFQIVYPEEEQ